MSQKSEWNRFVRERRPQLHDVYPCAMPTRRAICPRHSRGVGQVSGLCKRCRDGLYEQLAGEYSAAKKAE